LKQQWIQHAAQPASEVRVFALGWAQDAAWWASAMTEAAAGSADVLLLYAWHVPGDAPMERIASYPRRRLNAWSFGVWSAARYLSGIEWDEALAVNGTLHPVDPEYGIEPAIFQAMLAQWRDGVTLEKFRRRIGAPAGEMRGAEADCRAELAFFAGAFAAEERLENCFGRALIGRRDRIFPPERQRAAWSRAGAEWREEDRPHYWSAREAWHDGGSSD